MSASTNPEFQIGDRCTWIAAPDWWNPTGERIRAIEGEKVLLDYSAVAIPISHLILIDSAPKLESSPANKLKELPNTRGLIIVRYKDDLGFVRCGRCDAALYSVRDRQVEVRA